MQMIKKLAAPVAAIIAALLLGISTGKADNMDSAIKIKPGAKILVAYFSHSGNTREIARQITEATGADIFEIIPAAPYPQDYNAVVAQAKKEINAGVKPELKNKFADYAKYDVIFVGSPNWWSTIAPPVAAFLSSGDLKGKTIVPFFTHGGGSIGRCESDVRKLCPQSAVAASLYLAGSSVKTAQPQVKDFLTALGVAVK